MKILLFSITPLFPTFDMGGAQKHLRLIATHLAELGHDVTVVCTRRDDTPDPFQWHARARVLPILRYRQPFPMPYDTPAYNLANIVQDVGDLLAQADRFYMHDGEFLFPFTYSATPTVVGLRDNVYPETILGSFHFQGHRLIVISEYARRFFMDTVGRFFPELPDRLRVIRNGIDWARFQPTDYTHLLKTIPVDPTQHAIVLHPHRPEASKGMIQTIQAAELLVKQHKITNLRVLVPRWLNTEHDPGVSAFYAQMDAEIDTRGLSEHFVFHEWISVADLPAYFSMGALSFSLGHFAESFGNAVYESMGCGTPTVVARISTHRELMPDDLIDKVDYGDIEGAAALAADIIRTGRRTSDEALAYLRANFDTRAQLDAFADTILNAQIAAPMRYVQQSLTEHTRYQLPVWCYPSPTRGIYHDYRVSYLRDAVLLDRLRDHPNGFTRAQAGVDAALFESWYREGYLVPVSG